MHYPEVTKDYEKDVSSSPQDDKQPYTVAPTIGIPVSTPVTTSYTRPAQRPAQLPTIAPPSQRPAQMPTIAPPSPLEETAEFPWSSGLCDCFSDMGNCCITCLCPCVTFGQISEIVDQGSTTCGLNGAIYALINIFTCCPCIGCACIYSSCYRSKMRQQYSLQGNPSSDCLLHCFCECCALCQEYRELQSRGFDVTIGWPGNVRKQNRGASVAQGHPVAPIVEKGMSRDG